MKYLLSLLILFSILTVDAQQKDSINTDITMEKFLASNEVGEITIDDMLNVRSKTWFDIKTHTPTKRRIVNSQNLEMTGLQLIIKSLRLKDPDGSVYEVQFENTEKQKIISIEKVE